MYIYIYNNLAVLQVYILNNVLFYRTYPIKRHDSVSVPSKRAAKRKYKRERTKRNSEKKAEGVRYGCGTIITRMGRLSVAEIIVSQ